MKLLKLTTTGTFPVQATVYQNKKDSNSYYNVKHGNSGKGLLKYSIFMDKRHYRPTDINDVLTISTDQDDFILYPIDKPSTKPLYVLSKDIMLEHKKNILLFWEIPNNLYTDVVYSCTGSYNILAEGKVGINRGGKKYTSPAPIIELFDKCELKWTAKNKSGKEIESVTIYDPSNTDNVWDIKTTTEK